MRVYLLSLGAGLLVGVIYSLLNVRSPAPPVVALVGLLGILIGEQIIPVGQAACWRARISPPRGASRTCTPHIFGLLPGRHEQATQPDDRLRSRRSAHDQASTTADLILHRGLFTTLDALATRPRAPSRSRTAASSPSAHDSEVMPLAGPQTKVIDLKGRRVLPGLIDNHLHIIRGGLNFNMELRWDGVRVARRRDDHAEAPGRHHAAAAMGARGRRLHRAPVRREAAADHRRAQRRRARHAGLPAASLRPRAC